MGLFSPEAALIYDINLITQAILVIMLVIGWIKKKPYRTHGIIMGIATIINLITVLTIMAPSLILNIDALIPYTGGIGQSITIVHSIVGSVVVGLGLLFAGRFMLKLRNNDPLLCGSRRLMYAALILWLYSFGGGIAFYVFYYL